MFPSLVFRRAYDALTERSEKWADLEYIRILHLAATTMQCEVEAALGTESQRHARQSAIEPRGLRRRDRSHLVAGAREHIGRLRIPGACEHDTIDSDEVGRRLFSARAFDDPVAGEAARGRTRPGAEHGLVVEQPARGLEVEDVRRGPEHEHRQPELRHDARQRLGAFRIGPGRQADENLPAGDEDVAAIDEAALAKIDHRVEVLTQARPGRVAFTEPARGARAQEDARRHRRPASRGSSTETATPASARAST